MYRIGNTNVFRRVVTLAILSAATRICKWIDPVGHKEDEIRFTLAMGPHNLDDLRQALPHMKETEIRDGLNCLLQKGLVEQVGSTYQVAAPKAPN